jgi:hypothetical protein
MIYPGGRGIFFAAAKEKAHVQESLICIGSNMRINYNAH